MRVATRQQSGFVEDLLRSQVADKTNWRALLKGDAEVLDLPAIREHIASALAGQPQIFETLARSADERIFPIEVRLHTADYFGQPVLVASVVDISERKNAALCLEIEHDLAQALSGNADRQQIMVGLLQSALRFPELNAGAIYLRQADGSYGLLAHEGLSQEFVAHATLFPASSSFARLAEQMGLESIAFPAISCGVYGYPLEDATEIAVKTVAQWLEDHADYAMQVIFCCFDARTERVYQARTLQQ